MLVYHLIELLAGAVDALLDVLAGLLRVGMEAGAAVRFVAA